jgi:hypothetical protein
MEKPAYKLVNVAQRGMEHMGFYVPAETVRYGVCRGDFVKLIFDDKERMWVRVTEVEDEGWYQGVLRSYPVMVDGLRFDDTVRFHARHVADILVNN